MNNVSFENFQIHKDILTAIEKLGYSEPTQVQKEVVPLVLRDKDTIVKSQTGSGKTAAFGIPICEKVNVELSEPQALVLTPTRELAVQVKEDISNIGRLKKVRCAAVFGKHSIELQKNELKQRVHVVVGTPGRTMDHIDRGTLKVEGIKYLIIDEADEMLSMGFIDQVEAIIKTMPSNRVTLLFSATLPETIERLCSKYLKNPEKVEINPEKLTAEKIQQRWCSVDEEDKFNILNRVLYMENPDSCIMFCRTKENVDYLATKMRNRNYPCREIHGGMLQRDRLDTMQRFKRGEFRFLVATDVAARGIDIEKVTHIVNYDIPLERESYVHRIGRTGRAGSSGVAITFVTPYERRFLNSIEEYIEFEIPEFPIPTVEEAEENRESFLEKNKMKPVIKKDKGDKLNKEFTKIYINAGKKKKIRSGDIVGAITNIEGVEADDIGIIDIQDNLSYIDILNNKGITVLVGLRNSKIKGKEVKVQIANK